MRRLCLYFKALKRDRGSVRVFFSDPDSIMIQKTIKLKLCQLYWYFRNIYLFLKENTAVLAQSGIHNPQGKADLYS